MLLYLLVGIMEQLIINALKGACGNKNIKFQVIVQDNQLHIYANHRNDYHPNYLILEENVGAAIASLSLNGIDSVWLYSRPLGQVEPNWQVFVELPTQVSGKIEDTSGNQDNSTYLDSDLNIDDIGDFDFPTSNSIGDTGLLHDTGLIHNNLLQEEEINPFLTDLSDNKGLSDVTDFVGFSAGNSNGDAGLLQDNGLVSGRTLQEKAEINAFAAHQNDSATVSSLECSSLIQYCFVTNQKLLTDKTFPPDKNIMRMVKFFHHLSANDQHQVLPILEQYFREGITPELEKISPAIQKWFGQIKEFDDDERDLFFVWLSRYCFDPAATLAEFKTISSQQAAEMVNKNSRRSTEYSFAPVAKDAKSSTIYEDLELNEPKFQLPPKVKQLLLPGIWVLATIVLIILSVVSHNSQIVIASAQTPALCNDALSSPEYCRLAVNLAGEKKIAQAPESLFPLTEVTEVVADYGCARYANLKAGIDITDIAPETNPVISSRGEKIFPHIYVIEAEQKNRQQPGNIKVGCVYTTGQGQRSPKKLAADIIPANWPDEHYQQQTSSKSNLTFGIYTNPINLGLYTIFGALGIAIASWLNLGLKINHTHTVYLVALVLGIVQLIIALLPFLGLLEAIIFPILTILIASVVFKDFQLNWKRGYPSVAISILLVVAAQFLLYSLCLGLITSLV